MDIKPPDEGIEAEAATDSKAGREVLNFKDLAEIETAQAKHHIKMAVHRTLAWMVPASVILAFVLFWIGITIYSIHMFTNCGWLSDDKLHELRTILFSSVLGAIVSQGMKRYLD